jgi:putative SOS response-associated peptidase YedK
MCGPYAITESPEDLKNELVASLYDWVPVIVAPGDYDRWLGDDLDPADLIRPYPMDDMVKWPVNTRVNKPGNDGAAILDRAEAVV